MTLTVSGVATAAAGKHKHKRGVAGTALLAPSDTCAESDAADAPPSRQLEVMRCLVDFARQSTGLASFGSSPELDRAASAKSDDILRCDSFSHFACGRDFTFWMSRFGYLPAPCWRAAENIAWGIGEGSTARSIFRALIHSPEHRHNMLGDYTRIGIGVQVGTLDGRRDVHVWTQHFGSHCEAKRSRR